MATERSTLKDSLPGKIALSISALIFMGAATLALRALVFLVLNPEQILSGLGGLLLYSSLAVYALAVIYQEFRSTEPKELALTPDDMARYLPASNTDRWSRADDTRSN